MNRSLRICYLSVKFAIKLVVIVVFVQISAWIVSRLQKLSFLYFFEAKKHVCRSWPIHLLNPVLRCTNGVEMTDKDRFQALSVLWHTHRL